MNYKIVKPAFSVATMLYFFPLIPIFASCSAQICKNEVPRYCINIWVLRWQWRGSFFPVHQLVKIFFDKLNSSSQTMILYADQRPCASLFAMEKQDRTAGGQNCGVEHVLAAKRHAKAGANIFALRQGENRV